MGRKQFQMESKATDGNLNYWSFCSFGRT